MDFFSARDLKSILITKYHCCMIENITVNMIDAANPLCGNQVNQTLNMNMYMIWCVEVSKVILNCYTYKYNES